MKQYRLETTTENGNVIVSKRTMTKEEMKKAIATYHYTKETGQTRNCRRKDSQDKIQND